MYYYGVTSYGCSTGVFGSMRKAESLFGQQRRDPNRTYIRREGLLHAQVKLSIWLTSPLQHQHHFLLDVCVLCQFEVIISNLYPLLGLCCMYSPQQRKSKQTQCKSGD